MKTITLLLTIFVIGCSRGNMTQRAKCLEEMKTPDVVETSDQGVWIGRDEKGAVWRITFDANYKPYKTLIFGPNSLEK